MEFLRSLLTSFQIRRMTDQPVRKNLVRTALFRNDAVFDYLDPQHIQNLSRMHWTPVSVARKVSNFLAIPNARVLDIGSGVGKFCITAGFFHPETTFYGIEQRQALHAFAQVAKEEIDLPNVHFLLGNLTGLDFSGFDHFYFYNPFFENIDQDSRIDYTVKASCELYQRYSRLVFGMLEKKPPETRLVTFHASDSQVPPAYQLVNNSHGGALSMWIRQ